MACEKRRGERAVKRRERTVEQRAEQCRRLRAAIEALEAREERRATELERLSRL